MTQSDLVARARRGEAAAIANLIGHSLAAKGITARAEWQGDDLQVLLEGDSLPPAPVLVPSLRQGFERLAINRPLATIRLYARRPGHDFPDWTETFALTELCSQPPSKPVAESPTPTPPRPTALPGIQETPLTPPSAASPLPPSPATPYLSDTALIALTHLTPLLGYLVFVGNSWIGLPFFMTGSFLLPWRIVPPLALLLAKGKESAFIQSQSQEALNFQLSLTLYWLLTLMLMLVLVGFLLVIPLAFFEILCVVVAAVKASNNQPFRYPLIIRFIR